jgi:amidase
MTALAKIEAGAFVGGARGALRLREDGPLAGLTFGVKDLYDVAGYVTGCGNPDIAAAAVPAEATAPAIAAALEAGATFVGKTFTDEVACGMFGTNPHYGTPINAAVPERVPGGSSSGSASAVAGGLCDFAYGTDTGGSSRVPASFCGIYGVRTSYGRISTAGVMAMAPSFDTVGWLARDAETLRRVGSLYFDAPAPLRPRFLLARDAFDIPRADIGAALLPIARSFDPAAEIALYGPDYGDWLDVFGPLQLYDLRLTLGAWATKPGRTISQSVRERIALAMTVDPLALIAATKRRDVLTNWLAHTLGDDGILLLPTAHDLPPLRETPIEALTAFRQRTLALTSVASLARAPQISVPVATVEGCPVGLSLLAAPGRDAFLLDVVASIAGVRA